MNTPSERACLIAEYETDLKLREQAIATSQQRADALREVIARLKKEYAEQLVVESKSRGD